MTARIAPPARRLAVAALSVAAALAAGHARAAQVGDVFEIALENHNWTVNGGGYVPGNLALYQNPAAPYLNSLMNGTNVASPQVAYASNYLNAGTAEHPSEPNYVWAEAGTNFNPIATGAATATNKGTIVGNTINNDADPSAASKNILSDVPHLTGQMNAAGVAWQNYQEDYQITNATTPTGGSPVVSKSGTSTGAGAVVNPYYGTGQYNYAVKHNPMAFFSDTATQNVNTFDKLRGDLAADTASAANPTPTSNFGRYNWITPNQYNDMHSNVGTFTYNGTAYTGDQSAVATGDNFLAKVIPQIMATDAYKNDGAIVIWDDETEGGDTAANTLVEFVISPLAHPNVGGLPYGSAQLMSHSSDIKTMEEVYQLGSTIDNPITASETLGGVAGQYATVPAANDLSDLFAPGVIPTAVPEPTALGLAGLAAAALAGRRRRA